MSIKKSIRHITHIDPAEEWTARGWSWMLRIRGILLWVAANLSGAAWSLVYDYWQVAFMFIWALAGGAAVLFALRHHFVATAVFDNATHSLCHKLRDDASAVYGSGKNCDGASSRFSSFNDRTAEHVAQLYRIRLRDNSVSCIIRISHVGDNGRHEYRTVGRSSNMTPGRAEKSCPIPADKGLPAKLRSAEYRGAFIIPSVQAAIATGDYMKTPNDELPDCRSIIVAPINGWIDGQRVMVGTLSISSRTVDRFDGHHATPLMSLADILGLVYPMMIARLDERRRVPSKPHILILGEQ